MAERAWWVATVFLVLAAVRPAAATNHLIAIDEVLGSWQGDDTLQLIELRMLAPGQTQLSNGGGTRGTTELVLDDASGAAATRRVLVFTRDLARGETGARVLIATQGLATRAGITPDFFLPTGFLPPVAGRVCYRVNPPNQGAGVIDCVAYGRFTGDNGPYGPPTPLTPDNRALQRANRTGRNVDDWIAVLTPTLQNNAGQAVQLATLCGDDVVNQGEVCDGAALGGKTCADLGFARGTLACRQCHFDTSGCTFCGNDAINGTEECDGAALGGRTCATLGFTGGTLACTEGCRLTTAGCDPTFFVPGGGPRGPECFAEWQVTNAAGRPGGNGKAAPRQLCRDGDAGCDADGVAGTCTFTVAVCFDREDARLSNGTTACRRDPIGSWTVLGPAAGNATLVGSLTTAVGALGPSSTAGAAVTFVPPLAVAERCTAPIAIAVPTRGRKPGVLALRVRTAAAGGRPKDIDTLKLVCRP